jgi:hypothetical protein
MERERNVLAATGLPKQKDYRAAVARIIRAIQSEHNETDLDTAENIGCSVGTIRNARNEENDLGAVYIARIGKRYGAASIDPYMGLFEGRAVSAGSQCDADVLPPLTASVHRLAVATSSTSPGGIALTHTELLEMLPDLHRAASALAGLISRAERIAA